MNTQSLFTVYHPSHVPLAICPFHSGWKADHNPPPPLKPLSIHSQLTILFAYDFPTWCIPSPALAPTPKPFIIPSNLYKGLISWGYFLVLPGTRRSSSFCTFGLIIAFTCFTSSHWYLYSLCIVKSIPLWEPYVWIFFCMTQQNLNSCIALWYLVPSLHLITVYLLLLGVSRQWPSSTCLCPLDLLQFLMLILSPFLL